ncbi:hypothetical protein pf16_23 [Pseudomonas phage pf16]|uniref:Uncharacterized protein n=1 Tax=Pseudomonas phage pf16 TaxID=1815630 RepID=A0A1S5R3P9_9CAUD|nr:hypothetical protein FDG98_gp022 [Pseudomonas phage pf16]AND74946.1 hypothetical protein pf16_23 [Pseudomonas phage pf16]
MKMMKDVGEIKREWFHNKRCYEAFVYGATIALKLIELEEAGAVFFDNDGSILDGKWAVVLNGKRSCIGRAGFTAMGDYRGMVGYVGMEWDIKTGKLWASKREVNEAFKQVRYVMPKHFHSINEIIKELK